MPTAKQIKRIRRIISGDCKIANHYYRKGATCAIGALALDAGFNSQKLKEWDDKNVYGIGSDSLETLRKRHGLSVFELDEIQETNDEFKTPKQRRAAILALPFLKVKP